MKKYINYANALLLFDEQIFVLILHFIIQMDTDAWHTLIDFHKIASALPENNIPDFPFNEKHALILFLEELYNLPSLKK